MTQVLVHHLMTTPVITLFAEQTLSLVQDLMRLKHVRHIPIIDDDSRLLGLVSHRDLLRAQTSCLEALAAREGASPATPPPTVRVRELMCEDVMTVAPDAPAAAAGHLLRDHAFGCLPVVDASGRLVGIITDRDFLRFAVRQLELHG
ncbi:MAG: CBS domain-containing protein [Kofleriaceae bacterium]